MEMEEENNPKQKSLQLVEKFYFALPNNGSFTGINNINDRYKEAKQCALLTVDELLLLITYQPTIDYWNEVKQEILNLK